ncbi:MAG: hypothetical protein FWD70_07725 [Desulfuromonadales bacterium]|nr:hypothetical protein [Desulfuromonadales bacterium]
MEKLNMLHSALDAKKYYFLLICSTILSGCVFWAGSPHDNFVEILNSKIGKNIDEIPYFQLPDKENIIDSKVLPNGNIENKYKYYKTCIYFYEIDPKTRIIVGARFEGKDTDCYVNP